ncbi:MAG TPA: tetratricopeptide repeat protein [Dokdonella sp.]|uniref:tetratricopeptide repeat protein n=4 Tax=Dokdonella sp. TaxID=2291710 RepID=UPI002B9B1E9E|nr:tetratricopeptide repeat protein [Xanthomonadales bacterium]HQV73225.1 tetratricopeptide repeat protein [Dokdonella sp.]HQW77157.1 tetratricopeptide repeat protein [Dokdonella sp.]HQX66175.1 tetratricopeptide repeat protein [Dokdonella sp.]HQY55777.1 tetratricopeptide repeat protein [Dokdonella sp.]
MNGELDNGLGRKRRAFAVLRDVLDFPAAEQAQVAVERCADDAALAAEVGRMLAAERAGVLDGAASDLAARLAEDEALVDELEPGTQLGGWLLVRALGSGGMGMVYLAERAGDGYVQRGALKQIKRGMDSAAVLARFRQERQILSRLVHPHIAHLLDGGLGEDGRPYFVMEYIDGEPLSKWMARAHPDLDARVQVFLSICEAIAHAHHSLVIHRDIKPDNVLIDGNGQARLLDFGIAKLLESDAADDRTGASAQFVSRAYAAPEQLLGEAATTATDIFQLGELLFELLTDARFSPPASGALSNWLVNARSNAHDADRKLVPERVLHGDAAIIVARATDSEPLRRYATVEALARDVHAWRKGRPIAARPDSATYRLRRFVGRHRVASAAVMLALAAIIGGALVAGWQAREAAAEARLARAAQAFLTSVFDAAAPDAAAGDRVTARELLDRGSERIEHDLANQPRLRGEMLLTLGSLYRQLGQLPQAEQLLDQARSTLAQAAPDSPSSMRARIAYAATLRERGDLEKSEQAIASALALELPPDLHSLALAERGFLREKQGRFEDTIADARAALAIDRARGSQARGDQARDLQIEAFALGRQGKFDAAAKIFEQALADARAVYGHEDTRVALMLNDYGVALTERGRTKEAEAVVREALAIRRKRLGSDHPGIAETLQVLGATLRVQGRFDESQVAQVEALRIQRAAFGDRHVVVALTLNSLGMLDFSRRKPASAEPYFREALSIYRERGEGDSAPAMATANNQATVLIQLGRYSEAEPLATHSLEVHLKRMGEQHPFVMSDLNTLAQLEMRRENFDSAIDYARRARRIADSASSPPREGAYVHLSFANVLNRAGKHEEALREVDGAIAALTSIDANEPRLVFAHGVRAEALLGLGRMDEARTLAEAALSQREAQAPNDTAGLVATHALLARIARARNNNAEAGRHRAAAQGLLVSLANVDPDLMRQVERAQIHLRHASID